MQSCRIKTTGKCSSAWWNSQIVCPCQSCDTVNKDCNVFFMFYQTFCSFNSHLRHPFVMFRLLIKRRIDDFHVIPANRFPDIRYFLRAFINQKNDQMHIRAVSKNGLCSLFQQGRFTCLRRRYDHTSLTFSDWTDQIYDPHRHTSARAFQTKTGIRKDRGHIFKAISFRIFIR